MESQTFKQAVAIRNLKSLWVERKCEEENGTGPSIEHLPETLLSHRRAVRLQEISASAEGVLGFRVPATTTHRIKDKRLI